ncbi:CDP-glycerol glycerophosphotransferase family protein [Shimia sp. R9_3]|uniref:CDP-glycerol glycerophosphotransferase family protein n=1 Tax=Shimia sp. R9_3 TaxID=2821113 RepID=UPI001ADC8E83|nr:CDP-glycerol glycerophosphotransferase family protein [Shimia sp. R9_3]MBO9403227.1 CDP-glycerol glycerophosphotransferase family protein [Shimia sp. R9_3]
MTLSLIVHVLMAALIIGAEVWSRNRLARVTAKSAVCSLPETVHQTSPPLKLAGHGLCLFGLVASAIGMVSDYAMWLTLGATSLCLAVRCGVMQLAVTEAKRCQLPRYMQALRHPKIRRTRMALYFSEPRLATPYQVTMWLKPLLSLNEPFVIILRERKHLRHFPKSDLLEVLVVEDFPSQTAFLPSNIEVLFYVNNSMSNLPVIAANPKVTHIQLLHGDSDKPPSYNPMSVIYDHLFVAGEMAIDRYARHGVHIPQEKFRIVGRPQITLPKQTGPKDPTRKTILYMTTWEGMFEDSNFCSLSQAHTILHQVYHSGLKVDVIFKPHPLTFKDAKWPEISARIEQTAQKLPEGVASRMAHPEEDPMTLYAEADLLISDISSTVIDFLATEKPIVVTNPRGYTKKQLEAYPSVSAGYLASPDAQNLRELIVECFDSDPLTENRRRMKEYALGNAAHSNGALFKMACEEALSRSADACR